MLVEKYGWAIQKILFAETNQDSTFSHTCENSKMFNITSKHFSFFKNKPPANWVTHITRDFLTCYHDYINVVSAFIYDGIANMIFFWSWWRFEIYWSHWLLHYHKLDKDKFYNLFALVNRFVKYLWCSYSLSPLIKYLL